MLHITVGRVDFYCAVAVMSHTLCTVLQLTAGHVDLISGAAMTFHTLYTMLHITAGHVDRFQGRSHILLSKVHVAYQRCPCSLTSSGVVKT